MGKKLNILILEDSAEDAELIKRELRKENLQFSSKCVETKDAFLKELKEGLPDIILLDYRLPGFDGLKALDLLKKYSPSIPVIIVTGTLSDVKAANCIKAGAWDYILKDRLSRLPSAVISALEKKKEHEEKQKLEMELRESEEKYRTLFETLSDAAFIIDQESGQILDVNKAAMDVYRYSRKEWLTMKNTDVSAEPEKTRKATLEVPAHIPVRYHRKKDGTVFPVEMAVSTFMHKGRNIVIATSRDITERKKVEDEREKFLYDLGERMKELNCLYNLSKLTERKNVTFEEVLQETANSIPPAWQYPEITCARVVFDSKKFKTENFKISKWKQSVDIKVDGKESGFIEIYYLEEKPELYEGPFLKEERDLIEAIGNQVGKFIERMKTEETLKKSEQKYKTLYDSSMDAIMMLTPDEGFFGGNPATIKMFGCLGEEDFISKNPADLSPEYQPDGTLSAEKAERMMAIAMEKGSHSFEWIHKRVDEKEFYATVLLTKMELDGKEVLQATVRDISERVKAEEEIRKLLRAIEQSSNTIIITDTKGNIEYVNPKFTRLTGYTFDEVIGKNPRILKSGETSPEEYKEMWETITAGREWRGDFHNKKKNGELFWESASISPIRDSKGEITHFLGEKEDITERKKTDEALKRSEALLTETGRMAKVGGWEIDAKTLEVSWTEEIYRIHEVPLGFKPPLDEAINFFHPDDRQKLETAIQKALEHGEPYDMEIRFITAKGKHLWTHTVCKPITVDGKTVKLTGTFQDITEQKQMEQMLIQSEKMASIGTIAAGIAHEINNPIGYIYSNLNTLEKYSNKVNEYFREIAHLVDKYSLVGSGEMTRIISKLKQHSENVDLEYILSDMKDAISESQEGAEKVKHIVMDLKDFSRMEKPEMELADINEAIEKTLNIIRNELKYKSEVIKEFGDIPKIECDIQKLNQVFMNILINAVQAIEKWGVVTIKTLKADNSVVIKISDTGKGIQKENVGNIFDAFYTTKEPGKGTGLGLSISYRIIQEHNGTIEVESEVGKGTTFTIKLPLRET